MKNKEVEGPLERDKITQLVWNKSKAYTVKEYHGTSDCQQYLTTDEVFSIINLVKEDYATLLKKADILAKWMSWWIDEKECDCESNHCCGIEDRIKELEDYKKIAKAIRDTKPTEILKNALFDVKFGIGTKVVVDIKRIDYKTAMDVAKKALIDRKDNKMFVERLKECMETQNFGFMGVGGGGCSIQISAYMERVRTDETHICPRRKEAPHEIVPPPDYWDKVGDDLVCSYCGSAHPDTVVALIEKYGLKVISKSAKSYKWYLKQDNVPNAGFGAIKFYLPHANTALINLIETKEG